MKRPLHSVSLENDETKDAKKTESNDTATEKPTSNGEGVRTGEGGLMNSVDSSDPGENGRPVVIDDSDENDSLIGRQAQSQEDHNRSTSQDDQDEQSASSGSNGITPINEAATSESIHEISDDSKEEKKESPTIDESGTDTKTNSVEEPRENKTNSQADSNSNDGSAATGASNVNAISERSSTSAISDDENDSKQPSTPEIIQEPNLDSLEQELAAAGSPFDIPKAVSQDETDSNQNNSERALPDSSNSVARSSRESQAEETQASSLLNLDEEIACATNITEDDYGEEEKDDEELKMIQSTDENQDTETSFSASVDENSDTTVGTEAAGTDTTSDTEDSLSTDENVTLFQEDDEQHLIMPQQPDIAQEATTGLVVDSPRNGTEEEKTEVDECLAQMLPQENVHLEEILDREQSPPAPPMDFGGDSHIVPPAIENKRAEYVSVTVLKLLEAGDPHGLEFILVDRELRVSCIHADGLFANSPLAAFDKVLRINDLNVENLDPVNASHLLDVLKGSVTLIAQNPGGVADLVESQITKPVPESQTGIDLADVMGDEDLEKKHLEIVRVGEKSLFSTALLHAGDVVVTINGCHDLDVHTGNLLLSTAPRHCVVLARTKLKTQMAIARRPTHQLPPGFNIARAMEEARRQREEIRRKQGCYYNCCERPGACANISQWLGSVYAVLIALVMIGKTWQGVRDSDEPDTRHTVLSFILLFLGALLLVFMANSPWWFRGVGARFSVAQLVCNSILVAGLIVAIVVLEDYILFGLSVPLLIAINLPSFFVKREYGGDGNTLSDDNISFDDLSKGSDMV